VADFSERLANVVAQTEGALINVLPNAKNNPIGAAMHHAALNGGKRLRAYLVIESAALFDVEPTNALRAAAAIECLHAYSLVHDDLPCMDDDDLRRGKPTVHIKWDEATAVLAGDALQTLAFEILADPKTTTSAEIRINLIARLAKAAGAHGMILGQVQDIAAETAAKAVSLAQITELQQNKTGALIKWSACAGAILARQNAEELENFANALGLAFQIQDDVLDVTGDAKIAGKRLQKDAAAGKATFVSVLGLENAQKKANLLVQEACDALQGFGAKATPLRQVAHYIVNRNV
jgi:farnesyl diphosphate synthase